MGLEHDFIRDAWYRLVWEDDTRPSEPARQRSALAARCEGRIYAGWETDDLEPIGWSFRVGDRLELIRDNRIIHAKELTEPEARAAIEKVREANARMLEEWVFGSEGPAG